MLPEIHERTARLQVVRAALAAATFAHNAGDDVSVAGIKADEARLGDLLDGFAAWGLRVTGHAPLLLDFATTIDDEPAWLCWLENEPDIDWWHGETIGFMGRRPLADIARPVGGDNHPV